MTVDAISPHRKGTNVSPYKVRGFQFMFRKRLIASAAAAPLLLFAGQALAEITITDTRTAPVLTSTGADSIRITNTGKIKPTATPAGGSLIVDSNHNVINEGEIATRDVDNTAGILINAGVTANVTNRGQITIDDTYNPTDTDKDGDLDGVFAEGGFRYGMRLTGPGVFTGTILNDATGIITIDGNDSVGISVESAMVGALRNRGTISVIGDDSFGIRILPTAPITGEVEIRGNISVIGENAVGLAIDGEVTGPVLLQGAIVARGYRYGTRPTLASAQGQLEDDDKLQGGPAVRVTANVTGGILLGVGPVANSDLDNDGIANASDDDMDGDGIPNKDDPDADGDGITDNDFDNDGILNNNDPDDDNDGILDADDPDDNGDGINDDDLDSDGVADSLEGAAAIAVQGSAPALLIGSDTQSVTIGAVGAGDMAYGLVIRGSISANGILDDVSATGVQIGGDAGQTTTIVGGIRVDGAISAISYNGEAQAIWLKSGAVVDEIWNRGSISTTYTATSAPLIPEVPGGPSFEDSFNIRGIRIASGATVKRIINDGTVSVSVNGEARNAIAIQDLSGTLTEIRNSGRIIATVTANDDADDTDDANNDPSDELVVGRAIAIDVRFATGNFTLVQWAVNNDRDGDGVIDSLDGDIDGDGIINSLDDDMDNDGIKDADDTSDALDSDGDGVLDSKEPIIFGEVLFGGGDDLFDVQNGFVVGKIEFGDGADVLNIGSVGGIAQVRGEISDSDGQLDINLINGGLTFTNATTVNGTSLSVSGNGVLTVTADPDANAVTLISVNTATIADGAQIGLELTGLINGNETYTIIRTNPGGLTLGTIDSSLLGNAPYLVVAQASGDEAAGEVYLDVRRRTVTEMGLVGNEALALDAVYAALNGDAEVRDAFLGATTRQQFISLYQQMLPDQGEGLFSSIDTLTRTISRLTGTKPDLRQRYGPDSFWMQEINVQVMREAGVGLGSETKAFGFVGGYESMGSDGGALGATLAFISAEEKDDVAQIGEETTISLLEAGIYWRRSVGGWSFSARGSGGYAWFDGDRVFISPSDGLIRQADSGWNGITGVASASASYEAGVGRFFIRPLVSVDYLYMSEGERQETGGEDAFNLYLQDRTSSRLSATAELSFGATFGRELWWRPEVRVGYRQHLGGEMGDTVFRFTGGQLVALPASEPGDGAVVIGFSLKAGTPMSYVAMEGEYESTDGEERYNLQLAGRMMF